MKITFHINKCYPCMSMHHNPEPASYTVRHKAHNSCLEGIIFMLFTHFLFDINSIFTLSCLLPSFCEVMMLWFKLNPTFLRASMMEEWGIVSQWSSNAQEMKPPKVLTNYKPPLCVVFQRWHKSNWGRQENNQMLYHHMCRCTYQKE